MCNSLAVRLHCSWTRMLRHNRIIVLENFVTIWTDFLHRETVFACRELLVLLFVLAASNPILIKAPIVTGQSLQEGINCCRLPRTSNDTDLRPLGQIVYHKPWDAGTLLPSHAPYIKHSSCDMWEYIQEQGCYINVFYDVTIWNQRKVKEISSL